MIIRPATAGLLLLGVFSVSSLGRSQQPPAGPQSNQPQVAPPGAPSTTPAIPPKIDPSKEADIHKLMDLAGAKSLITQSMAAMEKNIRPLMTNSLPPGEYRGKLIDLFLEKFHSKADPQEVLDLVAPIYDKYLSDEEIRGLIQFYGTPLGQKAIAVLPRVMAESQEAGSEWGQKLGQEAMREVLSEHPDLARALTEAKKAAASN